MKKSTKTIFAIILIVVLGLGFWQISSLSFKNKTNNVVQEVPTTLKINTVPPIDFDISNFVGKTALEATGSKVDLVTNGEGINAFVTAINGRAANTNKHEFWELIINGSEAQVGAGSYVIQKGDSIIWQIDTY